jgi:hypothetical protein
MLHKENTVEKMSRKKIKCMKSQFILINLKSFYDIPEIISFIYDVFSKNILFL